MEIMVIILIAVLTAGVALFGWIARKWKEEQRLQFENLCNRLFEEKSRRFAADAKRDIGALIEPFKGDIDNFRKKAEQMYEVEGKERASLQEQIKMMIGANAKLQEEAGQLSQALQGQAQARGNWGEMILQKILELSGLREGEDYQVQANLSDEDGRRLRPDIIVRLPGERDVIIDSKVSLVDWIEVVNADDDSARARALIAHTAAVKRHIKELSDKRYQEAEGARSLEMVFMFIPIEAAYLAALEQEGELTAWAIERRVAITGPSTLMGVLAMVDHLWRMDRHHSNAAEVFKRARAIEDKFANFADSLKNVGDSLKRAANFYEQAQGQLRTGRGSLEHRVRQLVELEGTSEEREDP